MEEVGSLLGDLLPDVVTEGAPAAAAAVAEAPKPKPKKVVTPTSKKKRQLVKKQPTTVEEWLDARIADPASFDMTSEGNLKVPVLGPGTNETVLDCPQYYPTSRSSVHTFITKRQEKLQEAKDQYAEARRFLLEVHKQYKAGNASIADVLTANKQVIEAEQFLITSAYSERSTRIANPVPHIQDLLMETTHEYAMVGKKSPYDVVLVNRVSIPWTVFLSKDPPVEETGPEEAAVAAAATTAPAPAAAGPSDDPTSNAANQARTGAIIAARRRIKKSTAAAPY